MNKREKGINKKEAWSIWRKVHLKYKCSWSDDVIRSKFVRSKVTKSWSSSGDERLKASKDVQMILSRLSIAKDWKSVITTLFFITPKHCKRLKECIWNWSFIGQQPYQAKDHWWLSTSFKRLSFLCWQFFNVSFTPLYKGVKTY